MMRKSFSLNLFKIKTIFQNKTITNPQLKEPQETKAVLVWAALGMTEP